MPVDIDALIENAREKYIDPDDLETDNILNYGGGLPGDAFRAITGVDYELLEDFEFREITGTLPVPKPWWKFW